MQILLLQTFSTCFGRQAPIIRRYKILTRQPPVQVVMVAVPVPVAAVSVFYTPDDVRMTPETCRESLQ
jgi:hypothetical protein